MERVESLLKIAGITFEFQNVKIRFHKRQVSFLVVKTVKCKRGIFQIVPYIQVKLILLFSLVCHIMHGFKGFTGFRAHTSIHK